MLENASSDLKTLILLRLTRKLIDHTSAAGMIKLENIVSGKTMRPLRVPIPKIKTFDEVQKERKEKIKQEVKEKLGYSASPRVKDGDSVFVPIEREKELSIPISKLKKPSVKPKGSPVVLPKPLPPRPLMARSPQVLAPQRAQLPPAPLPPPRPNNRQHMQQLHMVARQQPDLPAHLQELKPDFTQKPLDIDLGELNPFLRDPNVKTIETEGADERVSVTGTMGKKPTGVILSEEQIDEIIDKFSREAKIPKTEGVFKVTIGNTLLTAMISETLGSRFILKKMS